METIVLFSFVYDIGIVTISGVVTDPTGTPQDKATVLFIPRRLINNPIKIETDIDGYFELRLPAGTVGELKIPVMGYDKRITVPSDKSKVDVKDLQPIDRFTFPNIQPFYTEK